VRNIVASAITKVGRHEPTDDEDDDMGELCDYCGRNTGRPDGCACADGKPRCARPRRRGPDRQGGGPADGARPSRIPPIAASEVESVDEVARGVALMVAAGLSAVVELIVGETVKALTRSSRR
jgi:hypothetical protein